MERALLVRHGESVYSARALMNGEASVAVGLTPAGVAQARALGERLRDTPLDLAVTSALERTVATADEILRDRSVPRLVLPGLNDPLYGAYEGRPLEEYRAWAASEPSSASPPGGGESRQALLSRYVAAFRELVGRPEAAILVVAHSLPISYALEAKAGSLPSAHMPLVEYATAYPFSGDELAAVADALAGWLTSPGF